MNALRAKIRAMRISVAEALSADREEKRQEAVTEAAGFRYPFAVRFLHLNASVRTVLQ